MKLKSRVKEPATPRFGEATQPDSNRELRGGRAGDTG